MTGSADTTDAAVPGGTRPPALRSVGIVGGTGALGRGLAARFARAGLAVALGSRAAERADEAAATVRERLAQHPSGPGADPARGEGAEDGTPSGRADGEVVGVTNVEVADRDVVVIAVPFDGIDAGVPPLAAALAGRIVVSAVNPMAFDDAGPHPVPVAEGSAAAKLASLLPDARMTAAFHTVSARALQRLGDPMDDDVAVLGDDADAVASVVALADRIAGCRGIAAGPLRLAGVLESLTPVVIEVNRRYEAHAGIRFTRL